MGHKHKTDKTINSKQIQQKPIYGMICKLCSGETKFNILYVVLKDCVESHMFTKNIIVIRLFCLVRYLPRCMHLEDAPLVLSHPCCVVYCHTLQLAPAPVCSGLSRTRVSHRQSSHTRLHGPVEPR